MLIWRERGGYWFGWGTSRWLIVESAFAAEDRAAWLKAWASSRPHPAVWETGLRTELAQVRQVPVNHLKLRDPTAVEPPSPSLNESGRSRSLFDDVLSNSQFYHLSGLESKYFPYYLKLFETQ